MPRHKPVTTRCYNPACGQLFVSTHEGTCYCSKSCAGKAARLRRKTAHSDAYWKLRPPT
jgi:hypothetical protein